MRLKDKVAIITGGASGIGRAAASLFAAEGAKIAAIDKNASVVHAVEELRKSGRSAVGIQADVSNPQDITQAVGRVVEEFGKIDILCNNAGMPLVRAFSDTTADDIDALIAVNLKAVIYASQSVLPIMTKGGGAIVNVASASGLVGRAWQSVYSASKAAVISLTKSMALAFAAHGIRVNCICPGSIDTPMFRSALEKSGNFESEWRRTELVTPLGRIGRPEEVASAMLFLASPEADFITGVALPVDGGRTAGIAESSHVGMNANT